MSLQIAEAGNSWAQVILLFQPPGQQGSQVHAIVPHYSISFHAIRRLQGRDFGKKKSVTAIPILVHTVMDYVFSFFPLCLFYARWQTKLRVDHSGSLHQVTDCHLELVLLLSKSMLWQGGVMWYIYFCLFLSQNSLPKQAIETRISPPRSGSWKL